jgi:HEAT repeat protein
MVLLLCTVAGCASRAPKLSDSQLRAMSTRYIQRGMKYPENPAVRAQAIEAAGDVLKTDQARGAIRQGLRDEHPGVRFAACMVLGRLRDKDSLATFHTLAKDPDPSVRIGAYFALERLGDHSNRKVWRDMLRHDPDATVRRNAALALGQLENKSVMPLLSRSIAEDDDEGVRLQASEALALLGDTDAINHFMRDSYGGVGFKQPFALLTLGKVVDDRVIPVLQKRLATAPYLEARLAAARSLGMHGDDSGCDLALKSLKWNKPRQGLVDDPPELQVMRVQQMAAMALGTIGQRRALGPLAQHMQSCGDPRVQLAAATAILMILNASTE